MSPIRFDTSSVDHLRSPSWPIPDTLTGAPSPRRSAPRLLTGAPRGGLRPPPAERPRRPTRPRWAGPSISDATPHRQSGLLQPDLLMGSWHTRAHILSTSLTGFTTGSPDRYPGSRVRVPSLPLL